MQVAVEDGGEVAGMKKYIDADRLLMEAKALSGPMTGDGWDNWGVFALIERQPAADVVEVVRCKDCKHWWNNANACWGVETCGGFPEIWEYGPDFYCAFGERRDG